MRLENNTVQTMPNCRSDPWVVNWRVCVEQGKTEQNVETKNICHDLILIWYAQATSIPIVGCHWRLYAATALKEAPFMPQTYSTDTASRQKMRCVCVFCAEQTTSITYRITCKSNIIHWILSPVRANTHTHTRNGMPKQNMRTEKASQTQGISGERKNGDTRNGNRLPSILHMTISKRSNDGADNDCAWDARNEVKVQTNVLKRAAPKNNNELSIFLCDLLRCPLVVGECVCVYIVRSEMTVSLAAHRNVQETRQQLSQPFDKKE